MRSKELEQFIAQRVQIVESNMDRVQLSIELFNTKDPELYSY